MRFLMIPIMIMLVVTPAFSMDALRVGLLSDHPPISFTHNNTRQIRGIGVDIAVLLGRVMHAKVSFKMQPAQDLINSLNQGDIDLICFLPDSPAANQNYHFINTGITDMRRIFINSSCKTVTCYKDLSDKTVLLLSGDPHATELKQITGIRLVEVDTVLEALQRLENGSNNVFISQFESVSLYLIQKMKFKNISIVGVPIEKLPLGIIVKKGDTDILTNVSISFGKLVEKGSIEMVRNKWMGRKIYGDQWIKYSRYVIWGGVGATMIIALVGVWSFLLKQRVKKVTKDLARSRQHYRDLIESSPDMIFLVNSNGEILHANEHALHPALLDSSKDAVNIKDLVLQKEISAMQIFLNKIFHKGSASHEFRFQTSKLKNQEFEIAGRLINVSKVTDAQACLFARNITRRNRMEEELIQSERLATIGKMAASVAHEINNPIGIILANAEELTFNDQNAEDFEETIAAIERNATRAGKITERLMVLSSPQAFKEEPVDVQSLIEEGAALLGSSLKDVDYITSFPREKLTIQGDWASLQQVIVNLLLNSINSLNITSDPKKKKRIRITAQELQNIVRVVINDSGQGIPKKNLTRIFEPFFTSRKKGFGLGLFISRRIIEKHGGIIYVESMPGRCTNVFIEIPTNRA